MGVDVGVGFATAMRVGACNGDDAFGGIHHACAALLTAVGRELFLEGHIAHGEICFSVAKGAALRHCRLERLGVGAGGKEHDNVESGPGNGFEYFFLRLDAYGKDGPLRLFRTGAGGKKGRQNRCKKNGLIRQER